MANYAFAPRTWSSNNTFRNNISNFGSYPGAQHEFDRNPDVAYDYWIRTMNPSNAQDEVLRRMYSRLYSNYRSQDILGINDTPEGENFTTYLSRLNPNYEAARVSGPSMGFDQRKYTTPARWVYS